jgi:hypothetical protein
MAQDYGKASSGSALQASGAIPEKWSGKTVNKSYPRLGLGVISNKDYEKVVKRKKKKFK